MKTKLIILLIIICASCAPVVKTGIRTDYIKVGDKKAFVQSHYGMPDSETKTLVKGYFVESWTYNFVPVNGGIDTTQQTTVVFINNVVVEIK